MADNCTRLQLIEEVPLYQGCERALRDYQVELGCHRARLGNVGLEGSREGRRKRAIENLKRQVAISASGPPTRNRQGLHVTTSTLWDQLNALADYLEPTYDLLRQYVLGADIIGVDETTWRLMTKKPSTKWWAWAMCCSNAVFYGFGPSRSAKAAQAFVGDFEGAIVCDGYKAYETLATNRSDLRLAPREASRMTRGRSPVR